MAFGLGRKNSPDDDIKKLSRAELLEMLIEQTRLADRLRIRNKRLTKELEECKANLERAASLEIIMTRLERIERIAAMHVGFTEEEIAELAAIGMPESEEEAAEDNNPEADILEEDDPEAGISEEDHPEEGSSEDETSADAPAEDYGNA